MNYPRDTSPLYRDAGFLMVDFGRNAPDPSHPTEIKATNERTFCL